MNCTCLCEIPKSTNEKEEHEEHQYLNLIKKLFIFKNKAFQIKC